MLKDFLDLKKGGGCSAMDKDEVVMKQERCIKA